MGAAASIVKFKKKEIFSVDPVPNKRIKVFAASIFKRYEWAVLKAFCQRYKINQVDLIRVFSVYLSHEEVYLRDFRVRTKDVRLRFLPQSKLMQEMADIFIPTVYLKQFKGLEAVENNEEVSFARFVITSYIFCAQQVPDLLFDFLSVLKQKFNIPLSVVLPHFAFQQLCELVCEDLQPCGALKTLKNSLKNVKEENVIRVNQVIRMGVKYPLLFFMVARFRKKYQHFFMGDKFWSDRNPLKLKHIQLPDAPANFNHYFTNENIARRRTAQMLVADCLFASKKVFALDDVIHQVPELLTYEDAVKVKSKLGYKLGKLIIVESELFLDFDAKFLENFYKILPSSLPPQPEGTVNNLLGGLLIDDNLDENSLLGDEIVMKNDENLILPESLSGVSEKVPHRVATSGLEDMEDGEEEEEEEHQGSTENPNQNDRRDMSTADHSVASSLSRFSSSLLEKTISVGHMLADTVSSMTADEYDEYYEDDEGAEIDDFYAGNKAVIEYPKDAIIVHDNKFNRDFAYEVWSGRSRWAKVILDPNGNLFKQNY